METILLILAVGLISAINFFLGAKVGQKVVRGEDIEIPVKTPVQAIREAKDNFEYRREQERLQIISDNIDNYDGTGLGQKDIPVI